MSTTFAPALLIYPIDGNSGVRRLPLSKNTITIGRDATNDIALPDTSTSHQHARLSASGTGWQLTRLPGAGPVFVNGIAREMVALQQGDQIVIGGTVLRYDGGSQSQPLAANGVLLVRWPGGQVSVPLHQGEMTMGRAPDRAIIIPSTLVSSQHAVLRPQPNGGWLITDNHSLNGLTVGGQRVSQHVLRPNDQVQLGPGVTITYMDSGTPVAPIPAAQGYAAAQPYAQPQQMSGPIVIGRDPGSAVVLPSLLVSRQHARLTGGVLEDLNSTNGTFVNTQRLTQPRRLVAGDRVQMGPHALTYDGARLGPIIASRGLRVDAHDLVRETQGALDHVTLTFMPGEFIAIAGGSGTGKTTLMKALAGIQRVSSGSVYYDGVESYAHADVFRGQIGYVPQANIIHGALHLERALYYAARLRLASDVTDAEIATRIDSVLDMINLRNQRDQLVDHLSGGEKRRANLAMELLSEPPILFLDEPNAGLDPDHQAELLVHLRRLSQRGQTVVMVTHHIPDMEAADTLAFVGPGGRLCYYGTPQAAAAYFAVPTLRDIYAVLKDPARADHFRRRHDQQLAHTVAAPAVSGAIAAARQSSARVALAQRQPPVQQTLLLARRYLEILTNDRANLTILLLQAPIIAGLLAVLSKTNAFVTSGGPLEAQKVLFFLAVASIWFGTSNAIREIAKESDIYNRERLTGVGIVPYIASKVVVLAALCCIQTLILLFIVVSFKTGLPPGSAGVIFGPAIELYIGMSLAGITAVLMGLCVSAFAGTPDKAIGAAPLILLPQILLAGVIFPISGSAQLPAAVMVSRWAVEALGTSADLNHLYYSQIAASLPSGASLSQKPGVDDGNSTFIPADYDTNPSYTNYTTGVDDGTSWNDAHGTRATHLMTAWFFLLFLGSCFSGLTYLRLRRNDPA